MGKGWTQARLAERIGVKKDTVSRWELGKSQPNPDHLERLAGVLPASVEELLGIARLTGDAAMLPRLNLPRIRDRLSAIVEEIERALDAPPEAGKPARTRGKNTGPKKTKRKR